MLEKLTPSSRRWYHWTYADLPRCGAKTIVTALVALDLRRFVSARANKNHRHGLGSIGLAPILLVSRVEKPSSRR
jgi:hypothetical protein